MMPEPDHFKQIYLGLIVSVLALKYSLVFLYLVGGAIPALQFAGLGELGVLVPVVALLLGIREAKRHGGIRPGLGLIRVLTLLVVFGLGCLLAIADSASLPATAPTAYMLFSASLWTLWITAVWLFGVKIVGMLFWRRPELDAQGSLN